MRNCNCKALDTCNNEEEYEEFVPFKEYPVGGFFKIGKEVFKVVEDKILDKNCPNCDIEDRCYLFKCTKYDRKDHNEVYFTLYDTLPENEN